MHTVDVDPNDLRAAIQAIPAETPVVMLNLLRFKPQADYGTRPGMPTCTGREAYFEHYAPAFNQVASGFPESAAGVSILYAGSIPANLIAPPGERWDDIVLVAYATFADFLTIATSQAYQEHAGFHRAAALEDSRLIATISAALPA